jgi:hypothetical protein
MSDIIKTIATASGMADAIASTNWKSATSIMSTAFLLVPKIKELASDLPGEKKFDILISVLEGSIDTWASLDAAANTETAAELKADLRGILLPAVSALVTFSRSQSSTATTTVPAVASPTRRWKCF